MNAQQLLDHIIKPTHIYMGGNYESKNSNMLSLASSAIESNCGYYIKQVGGPALGIWQMEPKTDRDIWNNCDALCDVVFENKIRRLKLVIPEHDDLVLCPVYACAMARLKYAMDIERLPEYNDMRGIYDYYKRIYNTPGGASTWIKFVEAWKHNGLDDIEL